jgi:ATP-dependent protease ClpP protease subunit
MFHDMYSGVVDYSEKMEARVDFQKKEWKALRDLIKNNSKLTEQELDYMRHGELWLFAAEAKAKGIVDTII